MYVCMYMYYNVELAVMESLSMKEELPLFPTYLQEMFLYKPPEKWEREEVLIRLQRPFVAIVYFTLSTLSASDGIIFTRLWSNWCHSLRKNWFYCRRALFVEGPSKALLELSEGIKTKQSTESKKTLTSINTAIHPFINGSLLICTYLFWCSLQF